jgi:hypothetical protein
LRWMTLAGCGTKRMPCCDGPSCKRPPRPARKPPNRERRAALLLPGEKLWLACTIRNLHRFGATVEFDADLSRERRSSQACHLRSDRLSIDRHCDVTWIDARTLFANFRERAAMRSA